VFRVSVPRVYLVASAFAVAAFLGAVPADADGSSQPLVQSWHAALGNPLVHADPEAWMPVLVATSSLSEAAEAAKASLGQSLSLYPLGDVDRDGSGDLLVETTDLENHKAVLAAHSGRNPTNVLWQFEVPDSSYWYSVGDVDGDEVADIIVYTPGNDEGSADAQNVVVGGYMTYSFREAGEYAFVPGSTGKSAFTRPGDFRVEGQSAYAYPVVGGGYFSRSTFSFASLERTSQADSAGLDYLTGSGEHAWGHASVFVPAPPYPYFYAGVFRYTTSLTVERVDPKGANVWKQPWDGDGQSWSYADSADYTGDNVPDLLLYSRTEPTTVSAGVPVGDQDLGLPPASQVRVALVNGANGETQWDVASDYVMGYGFALPAGELRAGKRDVFVSTIGNEASDGFLNPGSRITVLDGSSGSVLRSQRWTNEVLVAIEFADVDGDRVSEIFTMHSDTMEPEEMDDVSYAVARPDYSPIWTLQPQDAMGMWMSEEPASMPDFDGDGVPDLLVTDAMDEQGDSMHVRALSGANGRALWAADFDQKIADVNLVDDVTGDGGADFAVTWFDRPKPKDAGKNDDAPMTTPAGQSHSGTASPSEADEVTKYPGFLEVHRGSDYGLVWKRQIHQPSNATGAPRVWASTHSVQDTNGNGYADLLYTLDSPYCTGSPVIIEYSDGSATGKASPESECTAEEKAKHLNFGLILDGADGRMLGQFPDGLPGSMPVGDIVVLGDAAPDLGRGEPIGDPAGFLPGFGLLTAIGAGAYAGLRRRRA